MLSSQSYEQSMKYQFKSGIKKNIMVESLFAFTFFLFELLIHKTLLNYSIELQRHLEIFHNIFLKRQYAKENFKLHNQQSWQH